jgi:hypothetical protein
LGGAVASLAGCVPENHPLPDSGSARFVLDDRVLYAADVLDDAGRPVLPRQQPYEKLVQVYLSSSGQPDRGAFVDISITPADALRMLPADATCEQLPGAFRCTAGEDGFANFLVRSESDRSGDVTLGIVARESRNETGEINVSPSGLPSETPNFTLAIDGVEGNKVPARYTTMSCTFNPVPDAAFDKWPAGTTRVREAEVRATPPSLTPGVIHNAPVIVQSLDTEAFVTLDPACPPPRNSRLRVQLDELGRSPSFYFCFSDLGTQNLELVATSGDKLASRPIEVDAEPRLLRVVTTDHEVFVGEQDTEIGAISGFNSDLEQVSFRVDVRSSDPSIVTVSSPTELLPEDGDVQLIRITPVSPGTARVFITPELRDSPRCETDEITVLEF